MIDQYIFFSHGFLSLNTSILLLITYYLLVDRFLFCWFTFVEEDPTIVTLIQVVEDRSVMLLMDPFCLLCPTTSDRRGTEITVWEHQKINIVGVRIISEFNFQMFKY